MTSGRPNVVWILLDQCRADVLGCAGHPFVRTPNIDRLARDGVLFENVYCQNPVCIPSRVSFMSGMYCRQTGVYNNCLAPGDGRMNPADSLLLAAFNAAGYETVNVGKVHLSISAAEAGFRRSIEPEHGRGYDGVPHQRIPDDYPKGLPIRQFDAPGYPTPIVYATETCAPERTYCRVLTAAAADVWNAHDFAASPLFLRLSLERPHTPVAVPPPFDTMYADRTVLPAFGEKERRTMVGSLLRLRERRHWDRLTDEDLLRIRSYYYGLVSHVDDELGRLLDAVARSPEANRTVVLFSSDHGCMLGEHGLQVKGPHYYGETARVPFILAAPGRLPRGVRAAGLAELVDLLPTLCELAGVPVPARAAGRSLLPMASGAAPGRRFVLAEQKSDAILGTGDHWAAVRTERYAYTRYYNEAAEESLFDLREDPAERTNLMRTAPPRDVAGELAETLERARKGSSHE